MIDKYTTSISLIDRVHRRYFTIIADALKRIDADDIRAAHAFILLCIGNDRLTANQVRNTTNYLGSKLNSMLRILVENGYVLRERTPGDNRMVNVWLSDKGHAIFNQLNETHELFREHFIRSQPEFSLERDIQTLRLIEELLIDRQLDGASLR